MKKDLNNFIKSAKAEKLSLDEKGLLRSRILEFISYHPIRGKTPMLRERNYISIFDVRAFVKVGALILIIAVVAGGSGVSYAAQSSLPGDALYNIKVNVNEAVEEGLARTPTARVAIQSKKVERRLEEAQTLAKANKLSTVNQQIVIAQIEEHIEELEKEIEILRNDGDVEVVLETTAKLTPIMEAHKEILEKNSANDDVGDNDNTETLIAKVEDGIKAVESEENATIAVVSGEMMEDSNVAATMMMTAESNQEDMKRDAKETIEEINGEIEDLVESRIDSAKDKIRDIKEKQEALQATIDASITPTPIDTRIAPVEKKDLASEAKANEESTLKENTSETTAPTVVAPVVIIDTFNIDSRLKLADDILKEASRLADEKEWREALSLAQEVNRIAAEIETHIHLKELDLSKAGSKSEAKASAIESFN